MPGSNPDPVPGLAQAVETPPGMPIPDPDKPAPASQEETQCFQFTGSGREYFRIWIVNLCLSIATLGVYSAWAKVRRLQYFHRNTRLSGAVFDFHGDPKAILKGRLIGVALLAAYHYAFGFSKIFGVAVVAFLLLTLPWMMRNALRFRLRNTSYRALRFNFGGSLSGAYRCYFPVVLLFVLPGLILAVDQTLIQWSGMSVLLYLLWPWLHARIKRYQHDNLEYGASRATYTASTGKFIKWYFYAMLIGLYALPAAGVAMLACALAIPVFRFLGVPMPSDLSPGFFILIFIFVAYAVYLLSIPYLQVRIYNLVWSSTVFPNVAIRSDLGSRDYIKLQTINSILTLLTLGLYRPFAVVRAYRYRLAHTSLAATGAFELLLSGKHQRQVGAGGDSVTDFLNFDLSW